MDIDLTTYLRFGAALVAVLGLIWAAAWLARRLGLGQGILTAGLRAERRRLQVLESLALDSKRRLVLVGCGADAHLLLLGPSGDQIVARHIPAENATGHDDGAEDQAGDISRPAAARPATS